MMNQLISFSSFLIWILTEVVVCEEICSYETFSPRCQENQMINITRATYGRMRIGKCVESNRGSLGCEMDVLSYFDQACSGKNSCDVGIPVAELSKELDCLDQLIAYLEVEYECIKVYMPPSKHCISSHEIQVSGPAHFLSSVVTETSQCGLHGNPWTLHAQKGQKIQLKLIDFAWTNQTVQDSNVCSKKYGYILNTNTDDIINICGGREKERIIYASEWHKLLIVFEGALLSDHRFLIGYEVKGCPDFHNPPNTWLDKHNDTITVGCITNSDTWRLKCVNNGWLGHKGNCTTKYDDNENPGDPERSEANGWSLSNNHVLAFSIGCVTVVTCCVTVIAGYYCVKRHERNNQPETVVTPRLVYDDGTLASTHSTVFSRPPYTSHNTLTKHTLLLNQPNPTHHSTLQPPLVPERTTSLTRPVKKYSSNQNIVQYNNNNNKLMNENTYFSNSMRIQNNPMFNASPEVEAQYFVLETPLESVTDDREQLYQSIHLRSTSSSVSD